MSSTWDITIASKTNLLAIFLYFENTFPSTISVEDFNIYLISSNSKTIVGMIDSSSIDEHFKLDPELIYSVSMNFSLTTGELDHNQIIDILRTLSVLEYTVQIDCENYLSGNIDNITIHNGTVSIKTQKLNDEIYRLCTMGKAQQYITYKLSQHLTTSKLISLTLESTVNYKSNYSPTNSVYSPVLLQNHMANIHENWSTVFESAMEKYPSIHMIEERIKNDIFSTIPV